MHIGKQIKKKRLELNMTQSELAKALNVSRSTVSNWEIERNYPDIQLVVSLSKILNIPLETLLQEDSDVVKKIVNDTKEKSRVKRKLKISYIIIILMVISGLIYAYQSGKYQEISNANQIVNLTRNDNVVEVAANLPAYRSLTGYYMDLSPESRNTLQITLITGIDLTMDNEETISIPLSQEFNNITRIKIIGNNKTIKSIDLN